MKIQKGDKVKVIAGKDKGKVSNVTEVKLTNNKIIVEAVNIVKKHLKGRGKVKSDIIELTKPINVSNVLLVCPKCNKPTRVGYIMVDSKKYRNCKKCKEILK